MKRILTLSALLAAAALSAGDLRAQASDNRGLMLNAHLSGNGITISEEGDEDDSETESGAGLGFMVGYGFSESLALYLNVDGAAVKYEDEEDGDERALGHADLGVRFSFGGSGSALRPYLNAAISGVSESYEPGDDVEITISGGGVTVGGGLQYFFSRSLALDAALQGTFGNFSEIEIEGADAEVDLQDEIDADFTSARLQLGLTWHP